MRSLILLLSWFGTNSESFAQVNQSIESLFIRGSYAVNSDSTPATAKEIMRSAKKLAKKENKNIFLIFHASWCGPCKKLDRAMTDSSCTDFFNNNYIICHLTIKESEKKKKFENPGALDMYAKYFGSTRTSIPFWVILDAKGRLLEDSKVGASEGYPEEKNIGYPSTERGFEYFISVLRKTSKISLEEEKILRNRFLIKPKKSGN